MKAGKIPFIFSFLAGIVICSNAYGQEPEPTEEDLLTIDTPITIDFKEDTELERVEPKKKRRKKNVFYGIKTKKMFTRKGYQDNLTLELFHYLKEPVEVDPYVRDIYWYDFRRKSIRKSKKVNAEYGVILHGPYRKVKGNQVLEQGIYFKGTKHGRWTTFDKNDILIDKRKYFKGWPKESLVTYYDEDRTKMKEIIPIEYGSKEGNYFYFHESGNIAVQGEYQQDQRVGEWTEYYERRGRRKKVIQYGEDPYSGDIAHILKEWNEKGELVYDREQEMKKLAGRD